MREIDLILGGGRIRRISLDSLMRILGVFQAGTLRVPQCLPDEDAEPAKISVEAMRRLEMSKGKIYTTLKVSSMLILLAMIWLDPGEAHSFLFRLRTEGAPQ